MNKVYIAALAGAVAGGLIGSAITLVITKRKYNATIKNELDINDKLSAELYTLKHEIKNDKPVVEEKPEEKSTKSESKDTLPGETSLDMSVGHTIKVDYSKKSKTDSSTEEPVVNNYTDDSFFYDTSEYGEKNVYPEIHDFISIDHQKYLMFEDCYVDKIQDYHEDLVYDYQVVHAYATTNPRDGKQYWYFRNEYNQMFEDLEDGLSASDILGYKNVPIICSTLNSGHSVLFLRDEETKVDYEILVKTFGDYTDDETIDSPGYVH